MGILLGHSGGYIFGFLIASFVVGTVSDRTDRKVFLAFAMIAGTFVSYLCGSLWYAFVFLKGEASFWQVVSVCVFPFLLWDALKLVLALLVVLRLKKFIKIY